MAMGGSNDLMEVIEDDCFIFVSPLAFQSSNLDAPICALCLDLFNYKVWPLIDSSAMINIKLRNGTVQ
mgnify:CR=1 FL=1